MTASSKEHPVGRAADGGGAAVEDVGVDLSRADVPVTEKLLHGADVVAVFQQVGGEWVLEVVARGPLAERRGTERLP